MRREVPAIKDFVSNEMNAIDYRKSEGHWLKAHMDDRQLSGTTLVNLSLSGTCVMTYAQEKRGAGEVFRVKLAPRSLQILTGESRYNFTHGIQKDDFLSPRRVSMNFRQCRILRTRQVKLLIRLSGQRSAIKVPRGRKKFYECIARLWRM